MAQYAAIMLAFIAFCHISTIGWIIFKYPKDLIYFELNPEETPYWLNNRFYFYFQHLYFVVVTCSTNGYGDITPDKESTSELIFGMIVALIGLSVLGIMWTLNNILLKNFQSQRMKIQQEMKDFNEWFKVLEVSSNAEFDEDFVKKLFRFFKALYSLKVDTIIYDNEYLDSMPLDLAKEIETTYHESHTSPFDDLFDKYDKEMCVEIIKACEQTSYLPDTTILHRGLTSPGMFWLTSGTVKCTYQNPDQVIDQLHAGETFGSFCVLNQPCRESYITQDICMVHFLPKARLDDILDTFGVEAIKFKEEATADFKHQQDCRNSYKSILKIGRLILSRGTAQNPKFTIACVCK